MAIDDECELCKAGATAMDVDLRERNGRELNMAQVLECAAMLYAANAAKQAAIELVTVPSLGNARGIEAILSAHLESMLAKLIQEFRALGVPGMQQYTADRVPRVNIVEAIRAPNGRIDRTIIRSAPDPAFPDLTSTCVTGSLPISRGCDLHIAMKWLSATR